MMPKKPKELCDICDNFYPSNQGDDRIRRDDSTGVSENIWICNKCQAKELAQFEGV